ncbi:protein STRUBBELIG-RECEPTOR FAMILY 6 isoform X6 [Zea mays]|uniref:protein STRUBBELIG-RECEPTOR FAMILY 6 isoform X6 n=1 Tax=Zea mays TaxID=4577 RepID=UPI0004DE8511|nr:protein STRUBBELIG-RECEPTOR FAMILY 6 isoform X6 [Zea mays]
MGGSGVGAATERVSAEGAVWPRHWGERAQKGAGDKVRASTTRALGLLGLYHTLESPWQLSGWTFQGGDPCGEGGGSKHWRGVFCKGPSIVAINISGLGVGGWLGPDLLKFQSLKKLDMSFNNIAGEIPSTLPPNVEYLNLAANKFEGNIPSSLPWLRSLKYLNFSYNKLSGVIGDVFVNMDSLETMDLSFNAFNSDLPRSFSSLTSLRYLYLQHNEFTGSVILLAGLPLSSLNIENNHFSGYVPGTFQSIPELRIDGNQFQPGFKLASSSFTRKTPAAPPQSLPPPPLQSPSPSPSPLAAQQKPKRRPKSPKPSFGYSSLQNNSHHRKSHSRVTAAAMASATCTVFVLLVVGLVLRSRKSCSCSPKSTSNHAKTLPANMETVPTANEVLYSWSSLLIGSDTSSSNGITSERVPKIKSWFKASKKLLTAKQFPAADILAATKDFNEECFIGEGLTGRVYRGEFSDGQKDSEAIISAKGYAAPELSDPGANDIKADIYSFGVILLVLLTGQKAFDSSRRQSDQFLVDWAAPHLDDLDSLERITDPRISGSMPPKAISSLGIIILLCVKQSPDLRPPMTIITDKLVKLVESTGLQKISTTRHLEIDAQDPSFITTRPYFEPSSTVSQGGTESCISR